MSANLLVDIGGTAQLGLTLLPNVGAIGSGGFVDVFRSGILIGASVNMIHTNTYCNVVAVGVCVASGPLVLQVQNADSDVSGSYTDPTSGVAQLPTYFQSGGLLYLGLSGTAGSLGTFNSGMVSGQALLSGFVAAAAFTRVGQFARVNILSGFYAGSLQVFLLAQQKTTGSGGGFSYAPGSGVLSV